MGKIKHFKSKTKTGNIYNDLTVVGVPFLKQVGSISRYFAEVECKCGLKFTTDCTGLRNGTVNKCKNCSFRARSIRNTVPQIEQIFRRLVLDRSAKKGLEHVTITAQDYLRITSENCYYCNNPPREVRQFKGRKYVNTEEMHLNGLDRLDSTKGYHLNNVVSCCTSCNYAKHKLTLKDFLDKIVKIYNNLNLK